MPRKERITINGKELITAAGLAQLLHVHEKTVQRWAREKHLPHVMIGTLRLFDPTEIQLRGH
jgi:excisionase family DNA binding protein